MNEVDIAQMASDPKIVADMIARLRREEFATALLAINTAEEADKTGDLVWNLNERR